MNQAQIAIKLEGLKVKTVTEIKGCDVAGLALLLANIDNLKDEILKQFQKMLKREGD